VRHVAGKISRRNGVYSYDMDEHSEHLADLDLTQRDASQVKGGVPPALPDVCRPPSPPGGPVPIPYPNVPPVKK
jgi:hypothetical protein